MCTLSFWDQKKIDQNNYQEWKSEDMDSKKTRKKGILMFSDGTRLHSPTKGTGLLERDWSWKQTLQSNHSDIHKEWSFEQESIRTR